MENEVLLAKIHAAYERQLAAGKAAYDQFCADVEHPREVQEAMLAETLAHNAETPFGKEYDFASISSVEDFKQKVPITSFDDYAGYVYEVMEKGTVGLVAADPIIHFSMTSGTMGNPKGIPYTQRSSDIIQKYTTLLNTYLVNKELGEGQGDGRSFMTIDGRVQMLKGGATYGALSAKFVNEFKEVLPLVTTSPPEAIFCNAETDTRYLNSLFLLAERNVRRLSTPFIYAQLELMRYIEDNWQMIVHDIETGTIDARVELPEDVRTSVAAKLAPNPERAAELRAIFEQGFDLPFVKKAWPDMMVSTSVAGAGFLPYTERIKRYLGDVPILYLGYMASEGCFSAPMELNSPASVLIPEAAYFEFVPLGSEDYSQTLGIEDLEENKDYEVIITTHSGFYRYRMRDAVHVAGFVGKTPKIEFLYRIDQTINMWGEKTSEAMLRKAAEEVARRCDFDMADFCVYPDCSVSPPRYEFLYEIYHPDRARIDLAEIARVSDEELRAANGVLDDDREQGNFGATSALILHEETNLLWREMRALRGASLSQMKPVRIIDTDQKQRFFYALVDRSYEA